MTPWTRHLDEESIAALREAAIRAGLATPAQLDALLSDVSREYVAALPTLGVPAPGTRLLMELNELNQTRNLRNGQVPIRNWLRNAAVLSGTRPEEAVFLAALERVSPDAGPRVAAVAPLTKAEADALTVVPEATLGDEDLTLGIDFLRGGMEASASVVKLLVHRHDAGVPQFAAGNRKVLASGTGWLIGRGLVVTNHHVVNARAKSPVPEPDASAHDFQLQAANTEVWFDHFAADAPGRMVRARSALASDTALDFAILELEEDVPARRPFLLRKHAFTKPRGQPLRERVNVLQHPEGGPMRLGFRNNFVVTGDADGLSYLTDTKGGSSGAPVCDDAWRVAALHRGWRSVSDFNLVLNGKRYDRENYGTPIGRILEHLAARHAPVQARIAASQPP